MRIAGIDLGKSKAAVSLFEGKRLMQVEHLELDAHLRRANNLHELANWVFHQVRSAQELWIEEPLVGRNTRVSLEIAQTAGAVIAACYETNMHLVPVTTWKASVVGKGNATKELVSNWLKSHYPDYHELCIGNQDRIDATCIGLYGVGIERLAGNLANL